MATSKIKNETDIVNSAYVRARQGEEAKVDIVDTPDEATYYEVLDELLSTRNWLFAFDLLKSNRFQEVEPPLSLGYERAYALPENVVEILSLCPQQVNSNISSLPLRRQLDAGFISDSYTIASIETQDYVFVDNILYTDSPLTEVLVKITPTPSQMSSSFRLTLITQLAIIFNSQGQADVNLEASLRREHKQSFRRAVGLNTKYARENRNPVTNAIVNYVRTINSDPTYYNGF